MSAFLYGTFLQWKLDIRSKSLLITCYVVPLLFFAVMGGIFTSINPQAKYTLIQSMTVMGVTMGAVLGLPPSLIELYASDIRKVYKANGVPMYLGIASMFLSAFVHLMIMSGIILLIAPLAFDAAIPVNIPRYFLVLAVFIGVTLSVGCVLGLLVKSQTKFTMVSQLVFLPSIMLSGIMFPSQMLPEIFRNAGKILPATWGFLLMTDNDFYGGNLWPLVLILAVAAVMSCFALKRLGRD